MTERDGHSDKTDRRTDGLLLKRTDGLLLKRTDGRTGRRHGVRARRHEQF